MSLSDKDVINQKKKLFMCEDAVALALEGTTKADPLS